LKDSGWFPEQARSGLNRHLRQSFFQSNSFLGATDCTDPTAYTKIPVDSHDFTGIVFTQADHLNGTHVRACFTQITIIVIDQRFEIAFGSTAFVSQILNRLQRTAAARAAVSYKARRILHIQG
jgi:hypothetical protein